MVLVGVDARAGHLSAAATALRSTGVDAVHEVRRGRQADVLGASAHATGAHEILIGAPRPGRFGRRVDGVVRRLNRTAPCPVVVIR